jgi:hypothetical protein
MTLRPFLAGLLLVACLTMLLVASCGAVAELSRSAVWLWHEQQRETAIAASAEVFLTASARRREQREAIVRAVLAGRLTLWEGAARLKALSFECDPVQRRMFREMYPGVGDDERYCRHLAHLAELVASELEPADLPVSPADLRRTLRDALARQTPIRLPDPQAPRPAKTRRSLAARL